MNFEEFKNHYFNGDEDRALAHCAYESYHNKYILTGSRDALHEIVNPLTGEQSKKFYRFFKIEIKMKPGIMTQAYAPVLDALNGGDSSWKYNEEFIKKSNPFGKKVKTNLLISVIGVLLITLLLTLVNIMGMESTYPVNYISYLYLVFGVYMAFPLCKSIDDYFEFNRIKKNIKENNEKEKTLDEHLDEVLAIANKKKR